MIRRSINKVKGVLLKALKQGTTPRKLAITCALGVVLSVFPVYGGTTLLCFVAAIVFRLNVVVIQAVNYAFTPVQLLLIFPFMQVGITLFQLPVKSLQYAELVVRFKDDFSAVASELWDVTISGIAVWLLSAIPVFYILFYVFYFLFSRWNAKTNIE
ncbi:MAG: DUF2062 domain-containing protein [Cyclobacteriaceae bacterium]|nr:DUF2062 domain-containing protein [Cyclobacteriaceae bacterium]MBX2957006.1 DUF2062 domain-containing protein [Cyclobacteriaceae bacterium]